MKTNIKFVSVILLLVFLISTSCLVACSDANMVDKLMAMHSTYIKENETLLSRYAWMGAKESGVKLGAGYKKSKF